jgi:predicted small metal-binding protein
MHFLPLQEKANPARVLSITYLNTNIMKVLKCRDAGFDCNQVIRAESENEILQQAAEHAKKVHGVEITPEMARQVQGLIKEEK